MAEHERLEKLIAGEWRQWIVAAAPSERSPLSLPPDRRVPLSPVALYAQLEATREEWRALTSEMRLEELSRYINGAWTLKDLVAHVASWAREFRHSVESVLRGDELGEVIPFVMTVMGPTAWNEKEVQARRERPFEEIVLEFDEETVRMQDLVAKMSERDLYGVSAFPFSPSGDPGALWRGPSAFVIYGKCVHDRHHFAQIRAKLASWR